MWVNTDRQAAVIRARAIDPDRIDWLRCAPFLLMHLGCLAVFFIEWTWDAVIVAAALYFVRMFGITGIYHRYFSHRTFRTSRAMQFVFAILAASSAQRGPLWWAANHREHHRTSDTEGDPHSPLRVGFFRAHAGWFMSSRWFETNYKRIGDFAKFPELVWLNRFDNVVPITLALTLFLCGGFDLFIWGFVISTTLLFHATASINSLAHLFGKRRYETGDASRNNLWLALITLGEGWHNNHHQHMGCTRQGFYWWEVDVTYYVLKALSWMGIIWDLKPVPEVAYDRARQLPRIA